MLLLPGCMDEEASDPRTSLGRISARLKSLEKRRASAIGQADDAEKMKRETSLLSVRGEFSDGRGPPSGRSSEMFSRKMSGASDAMFSDIGSLASGCFSEHCHLLSRTESSIALKPRLKLANGMHAPERHVMLHKEERKMESSVRMFLITAINSNRFCGKLADDELNALVDSMTFLSFKAGDKVVLEGMDGSYFFVVEEGVLEVFVNGTMTNTLLAGNTFGGIALLFNCPRTATVKASAQSGVWAMDGETFRRVIREGCAKRFEENRRFLNNVTLLEGLTPGQKDRIIEVALVEQAFKAGHRVIAEGEATTMIYCVKSGELSVVEGGSWGVTGRLQGGEKKATLVAGDCFGEHAALYGDSRQSTVVAETRCEVICICIPQLKLVLGEDDLAKHLQRSFLRSALKKIPVLPSLPGHQQGKLAELMNIKSFSPDKPIEQDFRLIVVLDGTVIGTRRSGEVVLKRGDCVQDDALLQVEGGAEAAQDLSFASLRAGKLGTRIGVLRRRAMSKALQDSGATVGGGDEQVIEYMRKMLLARKVPVFRDLSDDQINKLVHTLSLKHYSRGAKVFEQGEAGRAFFVIAEGEVEVSMDSCVIRTLGKGTSFGERAVLFEEPRNATVAVSSESADLWSMDRGEFQSIISPEMREALAKRIQLMDTAVSLKTLRHVRFIGAGSFGTVRLVEHRRTKMRYALKRVKKEDGEVPLAVEHERDLLALLDHPYVLRLVKTFETKKSVYMLTELITGGQLFMHTNRRMGVLSRKQAQFYVSSLVIILEYLHELGVAYRDLKPENVMLDDRGYLKLVDFGLAKKLDTSTMRTYSVVGTLFYLAPEIVRGKGYGMSVDIWSLGVMFYEFVVGRLPFGDGKTKESDVLVSILEDPLRFPGKYSDICGKRLIQAMLNKQPENRIGAKSWQEIKDHKFFKAGVDYNIFDKVIGRELEPPVVPSSEDYPAEDELRGKVSLSDAEELFSGAEDSITARVLDLFRRVKLGGDGRLGKAQFAKVLKVLDEEKFDAEAVDRLWKAMGATEATRIRLEDFLSWVAVDDGEAFTCALAITDVHQ